MRKRNHVIFTGTGRAGTTFLIALLTKLNLDTGFSAASLEGSIDKNGRAGLEGDIFHPDAPYIVKSPNMSNYIEDILNNTDIIIDHIFIPIRNIDSVTKSRAYVSESALKNKSFVKRLFSSRRGHAGGLIKTNDPKKQDVILLRSLSNLLVGIAASSVPVTFIHYPMLMNDSAYLFEKLRPILAGVSFDAFEIAYKGTLIPEWVHKFSDKSS